MLMPLNAGTRLGRYEILAPLGAGGMGEVYRARDTRLQREVAIKILAADAATDPERLHRFEQEARAASALNHPNILTIFDIGTDGSTTFLVSELLEGTGLGERLARGPCPIDETLDFGLQLATGLAAAHAAGIVHRDIKPDNLFITRRHTLKILDFGIARLRGASESADSAEAATAALAVMYPTAPGSRLGTIGYGPRADRGSSCRCGHGSVRSRMCPTGDADRHFTVSTRLHEGHDGRHPQW